MLLLLFVMQTSDTTQKTLNNQNTFRSVRRSFYNAQRDANTTSDRIGHTTHLQLTHTQTPIRTAY